jgi:AraC-like DNA-binding protein
MSEIYLLGSIQALFFIVLLISRKDRKIADLYLAAFLLLVSASLFFDYLPELNLPDDKQGIFIISYYFPLLFGPFLWFYSDSLINGYRKFRLIYLLHLLPSVIFSFVIFSFNDYDADRKTDLILKGYFNISIGYFFINLLVMLSVPLYIWQITDNLSKNKVNIDLNYSQTDAVSLNWLKYISVSFLIIWIVYIIFTCIAFFTDFNLIEYGKMIINMAMVFFIFITGYYGLKQPGIYISHSQIINKNAKQEIEALTEKKTDAANQNLDEKYDSLIDFLKKEKPYLDNELTLSSLADKIGIQPYLLSEILNKRLRRTFYDFIHYYRVEEAKKRLVSKENSQFTILAIAYDCGFNSKSTFNRIFKDLTGLTPSEYIEQNERDRKIMSEYNKGG